ncbi:MAG: BlaI/MecI/CopY family transcriptional regulator, partial [Acidobacteria bacterium]|nr:BlaI/MecI/CopY family transcriptional regulator [Acidobacteriota bacterium]
MSQARPPKEIPPPLELECLKALWQLGEANVRSVRSQLEPRRRLAYTTVMTLLDRLSRKGGVSRRKSGRAFLYTAILDRETMRRKAIRELTDSLFEGNSDLLRSYLNNHQPPAATPASPTVEVGLDTT